MKRSNLTLKLFTASQLQNLACSLLLALGFLFAVQGGDACAGPFRVSGLLSVTNYTRDGKVWGTHKYRAQTVTNGLRVTFTADVAEKSWQITSTFSEGYWQIASYDGTNLYTVLYDYAGGGKTSTIPAIVAAEAYPLDTTWYTTLPWLAFTSSSYIDSTNSLLAPWLLPRLDADAYVFDTEVTRSKALPHLPTSIKFVASAAAKNRSVRNNYLEKEMQNALDQNEIKKLQAKYPDGFLGAQYVVLSKTNVGGLEIPAEFALRRFRPPNAKQGQPSGGLLEVYYGQVTSVEVCSPNVFVPAISNRTDITDKRFRDPQRKIDYIAYGWTNSFWPDRKDPALIALYDRKLGRVPRFSNPRVTAKQIFFIMLCASFASLPVLWLVRKIKTNKNSKQ